MPTHESTLGVVLNWEDVGRLYHCLLEITMYVHVKDLHGAVLTTFQSEEPTYGREHG